MTLKKKNIYDFSIKLDDDYYSINGISYKHLNIDINESFVNSESIININDIKLYNDLII